MCAIIGYKGNFDSNLVDKLCFESRIRGLHAYGFSYWQDNVINTYKTLNYKDFIGKLKEIAPKLFIAHFRYSTSGDYTKADNNQPLHDGNTSLVFNGTISMKSKQAMEIEYNIKMPSENDGWILFSKINDDSWLKSLNLTYASAWLHSDTLCARKNTKRPLWVHSDSEKVIICSTESIFSRAGVKNAEPLKSDVTYRW
jgi:glutamine phosphoribosylpyrophosphate amidotransferase